MARECVVCGGPATERELTCGEECHEELMDGLVEEFGEYKKVVVRGRAYRVPTRDILEHGLRAWEIQEKYPEWIAVEM